MSDVYADGIGNVRVAGTNVRIDLLIVGPDTDDDGKPVLQKKGELIMPLQGLIRADAQIKNVLNQLTEKGVLKKKDEQKVPEKAKKLKSVLNFINSKSSPRLVKKINFSTKDWGKIALGQILAVNTS